MAHNVVSLVRLMLVTDDRLIGGRDLMHLARSAEQGGITSLQVRLKKQTPRELVQLVRALVGTLEVPVLVNDYPDIALAAGAAGVHLGPGDIPVDLTRRIVPPGFIIGASVGSEAEVPSAAGSDYWGVGPWRVSSTKEDAGSALGPEGFRRLTRLAGKQPCIAIGGVLPDDVPAVVQSGGSGVAVVSGILGTNDVEAAVRQYASQLATTLPFRSAGPHS